MLNFKFSTSLLLVLLCTLILVSCKKSSWDNPYDANTSLPGNGWQPIGVKITTASISKKRVTWEYKGKPIEGFKIDRKMGDGEWQKAYVKLDDNTREWMDTTVVPEQTKTVIYRIYAFAASNVSTYVEVESSTEIPAPSDFKATKIDDFTYKLSWTDNSEGEQGFRIAKRLDNGEWNNQYAQLPANATNFVDSTVFAVKSAVNIQYKIVGFFQSHSSLPAFVNTNAALTPPSNLTANLNDQFIIYLNWLDNSTGEDGFLIERKKAFGNWEPLGIVTQTSFTDAEYELGIRTYYRVSSFYGDYKSEYAETSFLLAVFAPTNLAIQSLSLYKTSITWSDNSIDEDGFRIERKINNGAWELLGDTTSNIYYDNNFELNALITYRVCSYKHTLQTDYCEVSYYSAIPAPANISGTYWLATNSMIVQWEDRSIGEQGFVIDRKRANGPWQTNYHQTAANIVSFTDTVSILTNYTYRIRAFANGKYSTYAEAIIGAHPFGIEMIKVEGGTFQMGCTSEQSNCDTDETPVHTVTLSSFYISKTEITQKQWYDILFTQPSYWQGCDNCPVENVTWDMISDYLQSINSKTALNFQLPTEAQWEFAARGGNRSKHTLYSGSNAIDSIAWYYGNSNYQSGPVAQEKPNELGIYDMSGNVLELCKDYYGPYSSASTTNPTGPSNGSERVARGGHYQSNANECRISKRSSIFTNGNSIFIGFRIVITP